MLSKRWSKHEMMHNDYRLAIVLKHNGILKIAGFENCKFFVEVGMASTDSPVTSTWSLQMDVLTALMICNI